MSQINPSSAARPAEPVDGVPARDDAGEGARRGASALESGGNRRATAGTADDSPPREAAGLSDTAYGMAALTEEQVSTGESGIDGRFDSPDGGGPDPDRRSAKPLIPPASVERFDGLSPARLMAAMGVILLHTQNWVTGSMDRNLLSRLRDFAVPFFVLTTFFLMVRSVRNGRRPTWAQMNVKKFVRLEVPFLIWAGIYAALLMVLVPVWQNQMPAEITATGVLADNAHLWFLQFLFLSSVAAWPLMRWAGSLESDTARRCTAAGLAAAGAGMVWVEWWLIQHDPLVHVAEADAHLSLFVARIVYYAPYIFIGGAIGLLADDLRGFLNSDLGWVATLLVLGIATTAHLALDTALVTTRVIFGTAFFLAALLPWRGALVRWSHRPARYSYAAYILHAIFVVLAGLLVQWGGLKDVPFIVTVASVLVAVASFAAAMGLHALMPRDWFLPLVETAATRKLGAGEVLLGSEDAPDSAGMSSAGAAVYPPGRRSLPRQVPVVSPLQIVRPEDAPPADPAAVPAATAGAPALPARITAPIPAPPLARPGAALPTPATDADGQPGSGQYSLPDLRPPVPSVADWAKFDDSRQGELVPPGRPQSGSHAAVAVPPAKVGSGVRSPVATPPAPAVTTSTEAGTPQSAKPVLPGTSFLSGSGKVIVWPSTTKEDSRRVAIRKPVGRMAPGEQPLPPVRPAADRK